MDWFDDAVKRAEPGTATPTQSESPPAAEQPAQVGADRSRLYRFGTAMALLAVGSALLHLSGLGGRSTQLLWYRTTLPLLAGTAAVLAWQAGSRARSAGVRRSLRLFAGGFALVALSDAGRLATGVWQGGMEFPAHFPPGQFIDLGAILLTLAGLMALPTRPVPHRSRSRLWLDLTTVLLAAAVFLWYFMAAPALVHGVDTGRMAAALVQAILVLLAVFGAARASLAGVVGITPNLLRLPALGAVVEAVTVGLVPVAEHRDSVHLLLVSGPLLRGALIGGLLFQLRHRPSATDVEERRTFSVVPYAAVVATFALLVVAVSGTLAAAVWPVLLGTLSLATLVGARQISAFRDNQRLLVQVDAGLAALREAVRRDQILAEAGTELMGAGTDDEIRRLVERTAKNLLAHQPGAAVALELGGSIATRGAVLVLALGSTTLVISSAEPLPDDVRQSFDTLQSQASMALRTVTLNDELVRQARTDALTGLANRTEFHERLESALRLTARTGRCSGVLLIDLDGFKAINDVYGHEAGDRVLQAVARRLNETVRAVDTVARLGGDEFAIVTTDLVDEAAAASLTARVREALVTTTVPGLPAPVSGSVGLAIAFDGTEDPATLVQLADTAMYAAKRAAKAGPPERVGLDPRR